jgi:CBS-domain-containing membrane protein
VTPVRRLHLMARRERRRGRRYQPRFALLSRGDQHRGLGAVVLLALLSLWSRHPLIVAPLGASCVLLFG